MGLFNIFTGKTATDFERTGDKLACDNAWGDAKLAFESALDKIARQSPADPEMQHRLLQKLNQSKESLAQSQHQEALALVEAGCVDDALELFTLAMELTTDAQLKEALIEQIHSARQEGVVANELPVVFHAPPKDPEIDTFENDADDHFNLLLATLPDDVQHAYRSYGYHFKQGYLALNQGDFAQAVEHLLQANEENPSSQSLVPLELATAYMNQGQATTAQPLLEEMVQQQPDLLPAFQLLCEIYWEEKDYDRALQLLDTLAPEQAQSMGAFLLQGETLLQAARYEKAQSFFQELLETYGWNEKVSLGLARALEGLDQLPQARDMYGQFISQCSGCGNRVDPSIKRKYADLSLACGDLSTKVLEQYLSLSQEDPANALHYCQNISRIYSALGYETESIRFQSIADALARERETDT